MRRFRGGAGAPPDVPAWLTVTVWPATASVPVRAPAGFAAMLKVTEPMPDPAAPFVTVIQPAALAAVHEHCVPVMMLTDQMLAVELAATLVGVTL